MVQLVDKFEYYLQSVLPQVYDDSLSSYELLNKITIKLNEVIEQSNEYFGQDIENVISAILTEWESSGKLADVINQSLFEGKADRTELTTFQTTLQASMDTLDTNLTDEMATLSTTLSGQMADIENSIGFKYYGSPEDYGAKGDGVSDDTAAIQTCINNHAVSVFQHTDYKITSGIRVPPNKSIEGNGARLIVKSTWIDQPFGGTVPANTILFVEGREPIEGTELEAKTRFIKDLRIQGDNAFNNLTGMYLGTINSAIITQSTTVNYAVYGAFLENISVARVQNGVHLAEVWETTFHKVMTIDITGTALLIAGQCVNNEFTSCHFSTWDKGANGVKIDGKDYPLSGGIKRPEGLSFVTGFLGYAVTGVEIVRGLAITFSNMIIDLNKIGITLSDASFCTFTDCWVMASTFGCVNAIDFFTVNNTNQVSFKGCRFVPTGASNQDVFLGLQQNGYIFDGCFFTRMVEFGGNNTAYMVNNLFDGSYTAGVKIKVGAGGNVITENNKTKVDFAEVVVQRL